MKLSTLRFVTAFLFLLQAICIYAQDFVPPAQAQMLVVVHEVHRTSGWYPGMPNAWETELLAQKAQQAITVAVLNVSDGRNQFWIRDFITTQAPQIQYLFLIGDAKRPRVIPLCGEDWWDPRTETDPSFFPVADAQGGNSVPAWYFPLYLETTRWGWDGWDWSVNDNHYADGLANCLVGRLPAGTREEIAAYVAKSSHHMGVDPLQPWTRRITFAGDNVYFSYNGVPGEWTEMWHQRWTRCMAPDWTVDNLYTSDYQEPGQEDERFDLLESRFNEGRAIVTGYGPRSAAWIFVNWYDSTEIADYEFTNTGRYPLIIGASCDLGGFDEWWYPYEGVNCQGVPHEYPCVIERLLVMPNAGCIAALATTGFTLSNAAGKWAECCFVAIGQENTRNFARIGLRATQLAAPFYVGQEDWAYQRFQLLGDPSLGLPMTIQASGHWTAANSPIRVTSPLTIESGQSLTIEPGTTVIFSPGVSLTVAEGARLIADGTSQAPIHLQAIGSDPSQAWRGIFFYSDDSQNLLDYCVFDNATVGVRGLAGSSATVSNTSFTNGGIGVTTNNGGHLALINCTISGSRYYGAVAAGRSSLTVQGGSITNSTRTGIWSAGIARIYLNGTQLSGNGPTLLSQRDLQFGGIRNSYGTIRMLCINSSNNNGWQSADVTHNHWCGDPTGRIPDTYVNEENDPNVSTQRCALPDYAPCSQTPSLEVFNEGWDQENLMQWDAAIQSYDSVMKKWPESKEAKLCPDRILFCEGMSEKDWQAQRDYFKHVADTTGDADLRFSAQASAAWCLVEMDQFTEAQDEFVELMNQADSDYKYQKAALQALLAELKYAPWDSITSVAPGGRGVPRDEARLDQESQNDPELNVYARIEELLSRGRQQERASTVPTSYALYQNYPNPFNPTTAIRFDLPEAAKVELKVFSILGQEVVTLVDDVRPAGAYRVLWDGKNANGSVVSSGMYVYQIKAGSFADAKKMVLVR